MIDQLPRYGLTPEDGMAQVWFIDKDGSVTGGAEASNRILRYVWWLAPFTYLYFLPGIRQLQNVAYRWVANNRYRLPGSTDACKIP